MPADRSVPVLSEVLLNTYLDEIAGQTRALISSPPSTLCIPDSALAITIDGVRYHHFPADVIRLRQHGPPLKAYILSKTGWTERQFNNIDWDSYGHAIRSLSLPDKVN